jgi:Cu(I)/Ag(I) efflux system membrane fusion protein
MSEERQKKHSLFRRVMFFIKFLEIRLRFIVLLVITAILVGYWDHIQNYYERWQRTHYGVPAEAQSQSEIEYYCGMHPFVVRDRPGTCPICGMELSMRKKGEPASLPEGVIARVQTSPGRIMQAGVQIEPVLYRLLTREIRSYGVVAVDEARRADIVARFPGRIEDLPVSTVGVVVKKGDPLARIYSPKYLAASQEYLRALGNLKKGDTGPAGEAIEKMRADQLVDAARKRLLLAGFTEEQLKAVAESGAISDTITLHAPLSGTVIEKKVLLGQTVEEGTPLYTVADLSALWVQVKVLESDIDAVRVGMPVEITSVAWPSVIFYGNVDLIYPTLDTESRSVNVRVTVSNSEGKLRPGMYANAVIRSPVGQHESIADDRLEKPAPAAMIHVPGNEQVKLPTQTRDDADRFLESIPQGAEYYTCPMHAEVVSDKPGDCPLCGMHLEKRQKETVPEAGLAISAGSTERWVEGYACPMHPNELSDKPGVCRTCNCGMKMQKWRVERVLSVPETAVIDTGVRKVVYVETMPGVYDAYAVVLGPRVGAYYPVEDGLTLGQRVVSQGSFLIDAEARLNPGTVSTAAGEPAAHQHEH